MEEQNQLLQSIIDEIDIWQRRPTPEAYKDLCCAMERERGFKEGLRLSGAIVRARLIKIKEEQGDDE